MTGRFHADMANINVEGFVLQPGESLVGHDHSYPHMLVVMNGAADILIGDSKTTLIGSVTNPTRLEIQATAWHGAVATQPDTVIWCLLVLRDEDGLPLGFDATLEQKLFAGRRLVPE